MTNNKFITVDTHSIFLNNAICFDLRKYEVPGVKNHNGSLVYTYALFFSFKKRLKGGGYGKSMNEGNVYFQLELPVAFTFFNVLYDVCKNGEDSIYIRPVKKYQYDDYGKVVNMIYHKTKNIENNYGITCYQGMTTSNNRKKNYRIQYQTNNNDRKISISVSETGSNPQGKSFSNNVNITTDIGMGLTIAKLGLGLCNIGQFKN